MEHADLACLTGQPQFQALFEKYRSRSEADWLALLAVTFPQSLTPAQEGLTPGTSEEGPGSKRSSIISWVSPATPRSCGLSSLSTPPDDGEAGGAHGLSRSLSDSLGSQLALQVFKSQVPPHFLRVLAACEALETTIGKPDAGQTDEKERKSLDWVVLEAVDRPACSNGGTGMWCLRCWGPSPLRAAN